MIKRIALVAPLVLLVACGETDKPNLVTVDNVEVVETDNRECFRACDWHITVKKGETTLKMRTSSTIVKTVTKGAKVNVTYNPENLEVEKVTFPDFENKEDTK